MKFNFFPSFESQSSSGDADPEIVEQVRAQSREEDRADRQIAVKADKENDGHRAQ